MKKILSIALIIILLLPAITGACATTNSDIETSKKIDYKLTNVTASSSYTTLEKTDVVKTDGNTVLKASTNELNQMLENSQISVIEKINQQELITIAEKINAQYDKIELAEGQQTIGAVISKDETGNIKVTEVIAEVADELVNGRVIETDEAKADYFLKWLGENAVLDVDGIYTDFIVSNSQSVARATASSFGNVSAFRYLYTAPYAENSTEYESVADSSRYLLATTKVVLYGYEAKTSGTTTYDSFKADIYVTPKNDLKVTTFYSNLYTPENSRYDVLGGTMIESDSSASQSTSITVTLPADVASVSGASTHTYTYQTGGKEVTNQVFYSQYRHRWIATPISPAKNASYNLKPGMVVETTNGTGTTATAKASLSYLKLKKAIAAYWISDTDIVVSLNYRNHTKV